MRKTLLYPLALAFVLGSSVPVARACINDREVNRYEKEFKSHYIDRTTPEPLSPGEQAPPESGGNSTLVTAIGFLLLGSGVALGLTRPRAI